TRLCLGDHTPVELVDRARCSCHLCRNLPWYIRARAIVLAVLCIALFWYPAGTVHGGRADARPQSRCVWVRGRTRVDSVGTQGAVRGGKGTQHIEMASAVPNHPAAGHTTVHPTLGQLADPASQIYLVAVTDHDPRAHVQ